jgi:hypothetical protein
MEMTNKISLPDTILLELRGIDFKYTRFDNNCNCVVSKAAKRQLGAEEVIEWISGIDINDKEFRHEWYPEEVFDTDKKYARKAGFSPDITVRTLKLEVWK